MDQGAGSRRERVKGEAATWVVRLSDPDCSSADRAAFDAWRDADPQHEVAYEREALAWERFDRLQALRPGDALPDPDLLAPLENPDTEMEFEPERWTLLRRIAAALVGAVGIGTVLTLSFGVGADAAYATAIGERRVVVLDDGSRIELNTNSEIRVRYRSGKREVELIRGEAVFDVAGDKRPFVVTTSDASFTAGESELTVRLREDGASVAVTEGAVQATPARVGAEQAATVRVAAGYGGVFRHEGGRLHPIAREEMTRALAWQQGAIALDGQPLADAVAEFNRYNVRQIVIADRSIAGLRLGGYFRTNDIGGFIKALRTTFPIRAEISPDGSVHLSRSGTS